MDLWIRSQNKGVLVKCNCLALEEQTKGKYSILNYSGLEFYQFLGTYEYEKALEVLNEIKEAQLGNYHYRCPSNVKVSNNENTIVYQMPEE